MKLMFKFILFIALSGGMLSATLHAPNRDPQKAFCHRYDYCEEIIFLSNKHGVDPRLTLAIILHESWLQVGDYDLSRRRYIRGRDGEYGLMQVMPYNFNSKFQHKDRFHPFVNIDSGLKYFKQCSRKSRTLEENVSKYNRGCNSRRFNHKYVDRVMTNYKLLGGRR